MPAAPALSTALRGKNVIISGGTTGIGRATAVLLAREGANVFVFGRHQRELRDALADIAPAPGKVAGVVADQASAAQTKRVFALADKKIGPVDILINNAALPAGAITDDDAEDWRYNLNVNLLGYIDCIRHAVPRMRKRGGGHIINIGSMSAVSKKAESSLYVAAKAAIQGFSTTLRKELAGKNIKVTLIEPGLVGTDFFEDEPALTRPARQRKEQSRGKMLQAGDIAEAVHYCLIQPSRCLVSALQVEPLHNE